LEAAALARGPGRDTERAMSEENVEAFERGIEPMNRAC
jgi:hypothetical protein